MRSKVTDCSRIKYAGNKVKAGTEEIAIGYSIKDLVLTPRSVLILCQWTIPFFHWFRQESNPLILSAHPYQSSSHEKNEFAWTNRDLGWRSAWHPVCIFRIFYFSHQIFSFSWKCGAKCISFVFSVKIHFKALHVFYAVIVLPMTSTWVIIGPSSNTKLFFRKKIKNAAMVLMYNIVSWPGCRLLSSFIN